MPVQAVLGPWLPPGTHSRHHHRLGGSSATLLLNKVTSSRCTIGTSRITSVRPSWSRGKTTTFSAGRSAWKLNQREAVSRPRADRPCPQGAAADTGVCAGAFPLSEQALSPRGSGEVPEGDTREPQHRGCTGRTRQGRGPGGQPCAHTDLPEGHRLPSHVMPSLCREDMPQCLPPAPDLCGHLRPAFHLVQPWAPGSTPWGGGQFTRSICRAGHRAAADKMSPQVTSPQPLASEVTAPFPPGSQGASGHGRNFHPILLRRARGKKVATQFARAKARPPPAHTCCKGRGNGGPSFPQSPQRHCTGSRHVQTERQKAIRKT